MVAFHSGKERVVAVRGIDFTLASGEAVAIVGESGSGKSVTALALTQLLPNSASVCGRVLYRDHDLLSLSRRQIRSYRGKEIAYIFQEAGAALNPVFSIGDQIGEAIRLHDPRVKEVKQRVIELLNQVGIEDPAARSRAYPHQLSGGMQQRSMIAMALACRPHLLIADEPTTALDVTTQRQLIDLLTQLRQELGMAILFITHNLGIVPRFADRTLVMSQGQIVEEGAVEEVLHSPKHPYTRTLLACMPRI